MNNNFYRVDITKTLFVLAENSQEARSIAYENEPDIQLYSRADLQKINENNYTEIPITYHDYAVYDIHSITQKELKTVLDVLTDIRREKEENNKQTDFFTKRPI